MDSLLLHAIIFGEIPHEHDEKNICVPSDDYEGLPIGPGVTPYIKPDQRPLEKLISEVLSDLGALPTNCSNRDGIIYPNMIRRTSYQLLFLQELGKAVLFCPEEGNLTFIVHNCSDPGPFFHMKKSQLRIHEQVERLFWYDDHEMWKSSLNEMLLQKDFAKERDDPVSESGEESIVEKPLQDADRMSDSILIPADDFNDEGEILIDENIETEGEQTMRRRTAVILERYLAKRGSSLNATKFSEYLAKHNVKPIPGIHTKQEDKGDEPNIEIFFKDEVDKAFPRQLSGDGFAEINGRTARTLSSYLARKGGYKGTVSIKTAPSFIGVIDIEDVPYVCHDQSRHREVRVYWEDELNRAIPLKLKTGEFIIDGNVYCSIATYGRINGHNHGTLTDWLEGRMPTPYPVEIYGDPLYKKSDIEAVLPPKVENGVVVIDGRRAISIAYPIRGFSAGTVRGWLDRATEKPDVISRNLYRSSSGPGGDVYWEDELLEFLPYNIIPNEEILIVDGVEYVSRGSYSALTEISPGRVRVAVTRGYVQAVDLGKNVHYKAMRVPVYRKKDFDDYFGGDRKRS